MNLLWTCLKCGRKTLDFRRRKCCSEPMVSGDAQNKRAFYYRYCASPEWAKKSKEAKQRAGNRCQLCNQSNRVSVLNTHHRTYKNLGNEKAEDLIVLCDECHAVFHKNRRLVEIA